MAKLLRLRSQGRGLPPNFQDFMETPHYNHNFHREGGPNAKLRDHLKAILEGLNRVDDDAFFAPVPAEAREQVRHWAATDRGLLEQFIILHDIGKKTHTTERPVFDETGKIVPGLTHHSFHGHEDESFRVLSKNNVTFAGEPIPEFLKIIIKNHIFAFEVSSAADIEKLRSQLENTGLDFEAAISLLIATTTIDLVGSRSDDAAKQFAPLDPLENFVRAFDEWKQLYGGATQAVQSQSPGIQGARAPPSNIPLRLQKLTEQIDAGYGLPEWARDAAALEALTRE